MKRVEARALILAIVLVATVACWLVFKSLDALHFDYLVTWFTAQPAAFLSAADFYSQIGNNHAQGLAWSYAHQHNKPFSFAGNFISMAQNGGLSNISSPMLYNLVLNGLSAPPHISAPLFACATTLLFLATIIVLIIKFRPKKLYHITIITMLYIVGFAPLIADIYWGNINRLQFSLLIFGLISLASSRYLTAAAGVHLLVLCLAIKPIYLIGVGFALLFRALIADWKYALTLSLSFFSALLLCYAYVKYTLGAYYWETWIQTLPGLSQNIPPVKWQNLSLTSYTHPYIEQAARIFQILTILMSTACFFYFLPMFKNFPPDLQNSERFTLLSSAASLGILTSLLTSNISWQHYYTVILLPAIILAVKIQHPINVFYKYPKSTSFAVILALLLNWPSVWLSSFSPRTVGLLLIVASISLMVCIFFDLRQRILTYPRKNMDIPP